MTDAVLSQIEQILQGIETRTPHSADCNLGKKTTYGGGDEEWPEWTAPMTFTGCTCSCDKLIRARAEIASTINRMVNATTKHCLPGASAANYASAWAAGIRAAGGTTQ